MIGLVAKEHSEGVSLRRAGLILDLFFLHLIQFILHVFRATEPLKSSSSCFDVVLLNVEESVEDQAKGKGG